MPARISRAVCVVADKNDWLHKLPRRTDSETQSRPRNGGGVQESREGFNKQICKEKAFTVRAYVARSPLYGLP